jgi:hypothetical protein
LTPYADVGTGFGQCLRHAEADTTVAARDQDSFAGEIECGICHNVPPNYFMLRIFFLRFNKIFGKNLVFGIGSLYVYLIMAFSVSHG